MKKLRYIKLFENFISDIDINEVIKQYLITALWTEEERLKEDESAYNDEMYGSDEDGEESSIKDLIPKVDYSLENIADDAKIKAYEDVKIFLQLAGDAVNGIPEEQLGHDIWLSRNGHGAGFFDRGYDQDIEDKLMASAKALKEIDMYLGDDKLFHFMQE